MSPSITRVMRGFQAKLDRIVAAELDRVMPHFQHLVDEHGTQIAQNLHRVVRAIVEVSILRLVTKVATKHPLLALTVALVGMQTIDAYAVRYAGHVADWLAERVVRIAPIINSEDERFLQMIGIDPHAAAPAEAA